MLYQCIECSGEVTSRHQAIACDVCGEWQHRRCKTGISSADYRTAVRDGTSLEFVCKFCKELIPEREIEYDVTQVEDTVDDIYMETTVLDITEADPEELQDISNIDDQRAHSTFQQPESDHDEDQTSKSIVQDESFVDVSRNVTFHLGTSFDVDTSVDSNDVGENNDQSIRVDRSLHDPLPPDNPIPDQPLTFERRHLIFATDEQLGLLKQAKRWYVDGTFKVTRKPFTMLLSIHAFVRRGACSKQVPLIYVLMSGRKTSDYVKVFQAIRRGLVDEYCLDEVVCYFEVALWNGVRRVFGVGIRGCVFHWGQAVWKHVQNLGLATEYMNEDGTYRFIRKLFCLPFLPEEHIAPTFYALCDLNSASHLVPLLDYIDNTWLQSATWTVENWCVYGQSVRTNNDCEGWHRRLNGRAGVAPPFYVLVKVLHDEASEASCQVHLVSEMMLRRYQRKCYRTMQSKIFSTWDSYRAGALTATALLKQISTIYMPRVTRT